MDLSQLFQGLYADYPFLAVVGPLVGIILAHLKDLGKLQGFGLLLTSVAVSALVILAYGIAYQWGTLEWQKAPLAVIITVAFSNLTANTALHAKEALTKRKE